jgi:hypothetical protein
MKIQEVFVETGEVIVRDMTADELKQRKIDDEVAEAQLAAEQQKAQAKAAIIAKLGLTADEAKVLLG